MLLARHGGRARVGQLAVAALLRVGLDHQAVDPARQRGHLAGPAPLGQQRADDVLLPRRRARGQARDRRRRAARAGGGLALPVGRGARSAWPCRSASSWRSTPAARARTAGAPRCPPTPPSRSECSRWSRPAARACGSRCSRSRSSTISFALIVIATVYIEARRRSCRWPVAVGPVRGPARAPLRAVHGAQAGRGARGRRAFWVALYESGIDPVIAGLARRPRDERLSAAARASSSGWWS